METKITKKELKEKSSFHVYTGVQHKTYVFFYDWKTCERTDPDQKYWGGYKFRIQGDAKYITKKELFDLLYLWVTRGLQTIPEIMDGKFVWRCEYVMAKTDAERFKIPLSIKL